MDESSRTSASALTEKKKNFKILPTGWMDRQGHQRVPWLKKKNSKSYLQGGRIIKDTNGCLDQNIPNPTYEVDGPLRTSTGALTKEKFQVLPTGWTNRQGHQRVPCPKSQVLPTGWMDPQGHRQVPWLKKKFKVLPARWTVRQGHQWVP